MMAPGVMWREGSGNFEAVANGQGQMGKQGKKTGRSGGKVNANDLQLAELQRNGRVVAAIEQTNGSAERKPTTVVWLNGV